MIADPDSTKYKTQRAKVEKMLELAERHFRDTTLVSGYDEFLHEEMNTCEQACAAKDDEPEVALVVGGRHPGHYFIDSDDFNDIVTRFNISFL